MAGDIKRCYGSGSRLQPSRILFWLSEDALARIAGLLAVTAVDHGPVFLATGWVGKCPREASVPLAPEDEFRIKSSCFCLGKS